MDKISELLQYVRRTNPEMTMEKLIEELSKSDYVARSINFTKENFYARHPKSIFFRVETNFSSCLASAPKQINRDYLRLAVCRVAA